MDVKWVSQSNPLRMPRATGKSYGEIDREDNTHRDLQKPFEYRGWDES